MKMSGTFLRKREMHIGTDALRLRQPEREPAPRPDTLHSNNLRLEKRA
jgi:hypothetical protein